MDGDLAVRLTIHPRGRWLMVSALLANGQNRIELDMVLDSGSPFNGMSASMAETLVLADLATPRALGMFAVHGFSLGGHEFGDLRVRVSSRLTAVRVDAILGLDFLRRFTEVCIDVPTLTLRLRQ